jgi:hypothetical protein
MERKKRKANNYVNNKDFFDVMVKFKREYEEVIAYNKTVEDPALAKQIPRLPEYAGACIHLIANRLATKANFASYPFKEEMVGDGIENCIKYAHNFNPEKTQNPFAYFTQIIFFAFLRRIKYEKKALATKFKMFDDMLIHQLTTELQSHDDASHPETKQLAESTLAYMHEFVRTHNEQQEIAKEKRKKGKVSK